MPPMVARSKHWPRCWEGCCDSFNGPNAERRIEKHVVKRKEQRELRQDLQIGTLICDSLYCRNEVTSLTPAEEAALLRDPDGTPVFCGECRRREEDMWDVWEDWTMPSIAEDDLLEVTLESDPFDDYVRVRPVMPTPEDYHWIAQSTPPDIFHLSEE